MVVGVFNGEDCFNFMLVAYTQQKMVIPMKRVGAEGEFGGGHVGEACREASQKRVRRFDEDFSIVKVMITHSL